MTSWEDFACEPHGEVADAELVPESGWGALLCWALGPTRVRRSEVPPEAAPPTRLQVESSAGVARSTRPRTREDQAGIDDDIDAYLAEAGVPPRPRGFRWRSVAAEDGAGLGPLQRAVQDELTRTGWSGDAASVLHVSRRVVERAGPPSG